MKLDVSVGVEYPDKSMNLTNREYLRKVIIHFLDMDWPNVSSCTSAVIDAKIERAMDMVKKHLMFAMQEEVEVLKERIVVLLDRIKQLEVENDFLKSNASPDVLRALTNGAADITCCGNIEYEKDLQNEDLEVAAITANGNFCNRF